MGRATTGQEGRESGQQGQEEGQGSTTQEATQQEAAGFPEVEGGGGESQLRSEEADSGHAPGAVSARGLGNTRSYRLLSQLGDRDAASAEESGANAGSN